MSALTTALTLEADLEEVLQFVAEYGGELQAGREPGVYWLTMHPLAAPQETFVARIAWSSYPDRAPSVKFADGVEGRLDLVSAWPVVPGYRPSSFDICMPFTAEAFVVHPEWATGKEAWRGEGNPFAWVVERLLNDMCVRYEGRAA